MEVLIANIPLPQNRFLVDLNAAIGKSARITHDEQLFWDRRGEFDVVHLHFPEYMTHAHEDAYQRGLEQSLIDATEDCLAWWGRRAKLVITRHVLLPHDALTDPQWEKMYEAVYRQVHAVVHFASASVDEFRERYRNTQFAHGEPLHAVIPHHNYASLPNAISRTEARRRLGISEGRRVMLVFGAIRNFEERDLILRTFQSLRIPGKLLLVSRWKEQLAKVRWIRLKYWLRDLNRLYYKLHPDYQFNYGFVEESDTRLWLNASDVLFIPRLKVLNSGNITLGMTFGKVVVGPDSWDVGQLLRETGNPVFDPKRPETAVQAVEEGFRLAAAGRVGAANQQLALSEWTAEKCAAQYLQVFTEVLQGR
jgi:glycosyltransferase involved in cell wall biosynthesis